MNDLLTFPMFIGEGTEKTNVKVLHEDDTSEEKMNVKVVNVVSQESEDNTLERDGGSTSTSLYSGDCRTTPTMSHLTFRLFKVYHL